MPQDTGHVQSVEKAFLLLECMAQSRLPMTLLELSQKTGMPKSTVHRLLSTMRDNSIIDQSKTDGRYRLGLRLFEIGSAVTSSLNIMTIAKPYMHSIAYTTGESVCLAVLERGKVIILDFVESPSAFHVVSKIGATLPAHCTVQGKIALAFKPLTDVRRILKQQGMPIYTPNPISTCEALEAELEHVRQQGYAVENSEFHVGLRSIAAPIYDHNGEVCYSFSVVSMFHKIGSPEFMNAQRMALEAAHSISQSLGYQGQKHSVELHTD